MLTVADRQQGFFDAVWCSELLPEGSISVLLAEQGERIVRDEDFADCYSERRGRPWIPPSRLAKVLLLAYRDGLSDERAMEAVRFDLRWKMALDLPIEHPGFHPSSLVRFRARLLLHGMERLVFERSLELATELGLLDGSVEQIVDSTPMLGAGHGDLVRAAVRKLIDAVRATDKEAAGELRRGLRFDYSKPRVKPEGDWQNPDARMQLLAQVATDAARALHVVETDGELMAGDEIAEAARLLARSSVRSSRSHMTRSRGRVAGVECATSSRRMIPRCAMVARPRQSGLPATSCTPRRRPRRRS